MNEMRQQSLIFDVLPPSNDLRCASLANNAGKINAIKDDATPPMRPRTNLILGTAIATPNADPDIKVVKTTCLSLDDFGAGCGCAGDEMDDDDGASLSLVVVLCAPLLSVLLVPVLPGESSGSSNISSSIFSSPLSSTPTRRPQPEQERNFFQYFVFSILRKTPLNVVLAGNTFRGKPITMATAIPTNAIIIITFLVSCIQ
mmetsp:Transcript_28387/g.42188  ORF Transcript_28387/g.42188 Transcript_28387/m.42188 type:complete len:201 (+) Transcript_28387:376-978(+)